MAERPPPRAVHLVGSVSLGDAEEVFRTVSELIGPLVRRIPDGETGERTIWAAWQVPVLGRNPAFATRVPPGVLRTMLKAYPRVSLVRAVMNRAAAGVGERGGTPRMIRFTIVSRGLSQLSGTTATETATQPGAEDRAASTVSPPYRYRKLTTTVEIRNTESS